MLKMIKQKKYKKALGKINLALYYSKTIKLFLLKAEALMFMDEFDSAEQILLNLRKKYSSIESEVDKYLKTLDILRKKVKEKKAEPKKEDYDKDIGNCKDAVEKATKLLEWSRKLNNECKDVFISCKLNVTVEGKAANQIRSAKELRNSVHKADLFMIVDIKIYSGEKALLSETERYMAGYGWYFYLKKSYPKTKIINIVVGEMKKQRKSR